MKPIFTLVLSVLLLTALSQAGIAQTTVNITASANTSTFSSNPICSNCNVVLSPGVTLTVDNTASCSNCTFTGGTVSILSGSNFNLSGVDSFKNETVLLGASFNMNTLTFYGDTVAFNASMNLSNGRTDIDSSRVSVNAALTLNKGTIYKDSLHLNSNLTFTNSVDSFAYSNIDVASGVAISVSQGPVINSTFSFAGSSSMNFINGMTSTGSNYYLGGTSTLSSSSTTLSGDNVVMTGTSNSFSTTNSLTTTNSNISMNGSGGTFSASSLTSTGGSITAATGSSISITNAINLTNTPVTLAGGTFSGSSLTTSGGSFTDNSTTVKITNAINLTNTPTTINSSNFAASSLTTSGGSFTVAASNVKTTNAISFTNTPAAFSGSDLSANSLTTSGSSLSLASTIAALTNADNFSGTAVTMSGNAKLTGNSGSLSTGASLTMSGTSSIVVTNGFNVSASVALMNGSSSLSSGSLSVSGGSWFKIGDGTLGALGTSAHVSISGGFSVDNTSLVGIANNNNYLQTTNSTLKTNTISCGGGGTQNACATGFVYGCATINSTGGTACTVLAIADLNLTAVPASATTVDLSWSDAQSATASYYLVERSTGDSAWTTIVTLDAGGYTAGDYHFEDQAAPAGTDDYRIARVDPNGAILYSKTVSVTIARTASTIGIYPNPATGHTFFVTTSNTGELVVNVYTMTGQLLQRASLKGQLQYPVQLPAQLLPGTAVIVQTISQAGTQAFPLLLR
jgi:trimeric autotransporter adhesin